MSGGWRCFHCNQLFTDEGLARQHFGDYTSELPLCIKYIRGGMAGGPHDAYVRVRKDEYERLLDMDIGKESKL